MRLNLNELQGGSLAGAGFDLPGYDVPLLRARTLESPRWVHFGAGNLFRAMIAAGADEAIAKGAMDTGILACAGLETIDGVYRPHDDLCVSVALGADGSKSVQVVGCIARSFAPEAASDLDALRTVFAGEHLQLCSFTITEKGYDPRGEKEQRDMAEGPANPQSLLGQLCALMLARFLAGGHPIALVSMDNCSRNGDVLSAALAQMAQAWLGKGLVPECFLGYLQDGARVSYPWTMIDKITPRPDPAIAKLLLDGGLEQMDILVTSRGGHIAPFVNAERPGYLVIEDDFPNGRPDLSACGFLLTSRDTVNKSERMKVCTCLNPLHTALAIFGCLLGFERISAEMADADLVALVRELGYNEGMPVVANPGIIDPKDFLESVLTERFPNPFLPDSPQRIATDTSQKLAIRLGETVKAYMARPDLSTDTLRAVPMVFAGWLRYLVGRDDTGADYALSPDPMLDSLRPIADHLAGAGAYFDEAVLAPLLRDARVFGVDLYDAGLAGCVLADLRALLGGNGAVRGTLHEQFGGSIER